MDATILIVDDEPGIRNSVHEFIGMAGYKSFETSSAEEALEILKTNTIHVVITDIKLPGMNGLELTDLIKNSYDTDVIVMTGYVGDYSYEEAINKGASDFVSKPIRFEELLLRLRRVLRERNITKERALMLARLQELAITDNLTTLYNSRCFYKQLDSEIDRSRRYNHPITLMFMDIDHFKRYNDTYGHLEGDKVLSRFAQIIKSCLRKMDTAYRYGGEEFTVILPETSRGEVMTVAKRIMAAIENEKFSPPSGKSISMTISIGVTEYCPGERISTFVQRADKAMYLSKQRGRNQISTIFSDKDSESTDS
ncbi:MAG: diguanylate cyclase [Proteobacteria bacterium]|nr:diguanylate cyclase [Pseudomonadota bacterium]MBU3979924.1 diguanylate cyclase [Pseudomonadota bacterium]MBU4013066.1 diguanylate cyclase [Pseudomonadota bacterium]MBU4069177.1 diguanylate cyclase [Pseudomonadota bacterium]MBU4101064.1 diguanylate cyclase [Pseudomonadota bacterium]